MDRRSYKGDTEAARLHNLGVAHEALAYKLRAWDSRSSTAARAGGRRVPDRRARAWIRPQKYFAEPVQPRRDEHGVYARAAADLMAARGALRRRAPKPAD